MSEALLADFDTNVLISALCSRNGTSFELLKRVKADFEGLKASTSDEFRQQSMAWVGSRISIDI